MRYYIYIILLLGCCLRVKAQLSDSLYKALPDTLRPKNKLAVTDKELIAIFDNPSLTTVKQHFYKEMDGFKLQLEKNMTAQKGEQIIPYASAIGTYYITIGKEKETIPYWKKITAAYKNSKTYYEATFYAYINLSVLLAKQGREDLAIIYLQQAHRLAVANNRESHVMTTYEPYKIIYLNLHLYSRAIAYADTCLAFVPADRKWDRRYTRNITDKAQLYADWFSDSGKPTYADSAKRYFRLAIEAKKNDPAFLSYNRYWYSGLGKLYYQEGNYKKAIIYFDSTLSEKYGPVNLIDPKVRASTIFYRAAALVKSGDKGGIHLLDTLQLSTKDYILQKDFYELKYEYAVTHNLWKSALAYHTKYEAYLDSIDVIGQKGKVFEAEQKYSVSQKEAAIAVLETKNLQAEAFRNKVIVTAIISVLLLAIIALLFYQRNKRQQAQRLLERQRMADELHSMEQELELDRLRQQAENEAAIVGQRKAISKNMHDEVSSDLAAVRYFIADLKGRVKTTEARQVLADVEEEVQTVYQQSRDFMHRLNESNVPEVYNVFNLLENLSLRFGEDSTLQIHTQADSRLERKLTAKQQTELYKTIKEAVANCLKHSGANRMDIGMEDQGDTITLDIKDNGQGIKAEPGQGLGMTTMRERVGSLGGDLELSPSERGLHIHISFPKAG